jgi:hypothetical protein
MLENASRGNLEMTIHRGNSTITSCVVSTTKCGRTTVTQLVLVLSGLWGDVPIIIIMSRHASTHRVGAANAAIREG